MALNSADVEQKRVEVSGQHKNRVIKVDGGAIDLRTGTGGVAPADLRWLP